MLCMKIHHKGEIVAFVKKAKRLLAKREARAEPLSAFEAFYYRILKEMACFE